MKMEKRNLTCIGCPMGCALLVEMDGKEIISVTGNTCKKGAEYAVKEVTDPTRIVTTTVRVKNGSCLLYTSLPEVLQSGDDLKFIHGFPATVQVDDVTDIFYGLGMPFTG